MFGKNRTAPVPAHGKRSLSIKTEKVSVSISDEVLDSIVDQLEARMLKRSKGKQNAKQPHVRIELDDIAGTPKVFIDGVEQQEVHHIELGWDEEDVCLNNRYRIDFMDSLGRLHGIGQGE